MESKKLFTSYKKAVRGGDQAKAQIYLRRFIQTNKEVLEDEERYRITPKQTEQAKSEEYDIFISNFCNAHKLSSRIVTPEKTENLISLYFSNIRDKLMATQKAHDDILNFFKNTKRHNECIEAYIRMAILLNSDQKEYVETTYESGEDEDVVRCAHDAWEYAFYLMKIMAVVIHTCISVMDQDQMMRRNKTKVNMAEDGMMKQKNINFARVHEYVSFCLSADRCVCLDQQDNYGNTCWWCPRVASKSARGVVDLRKQNPKDHSKDDSRIFVFCSNCVPLADSIIHMVFYRSIIRAKMLSSTLGLKEFAEKEILHGKEYISTAVKNVIAKLCFAEYAQMPDNVVLSQMEKSEICLFDHQSKMFNPHKIEYTSITYTEPEAMEIL